MFESCSAYQASQSILFLSHCVPNPPDKGEKIRAYHELEYLAARYRVHLLCFARQPREVEQALDLRDRCASVYVELLPPAALALAFARFAGGRSLTESLYYSPSMAKRASELAGSAACSVVFSSAMAQYAAADLPMVMDMVDVDSEKWRAYSLCRFPGAAYGLEASRLQSVEREAAARAVRSFVVTGQEMRALHQIAPAAAVSVLENGVDSAYFDPNSVDPAADARGNYCVFVGAMDYYPNVSAAEQFARQVMPVLRLQDPSLEFWIVGRNPSGRVKALAEIPYVRVVGSTPDVRPYIAGSRVVVAPLGIARGIQNKVIEALAMGKLVLVSPAVAATFGRDLPQGVVPCVSPSDYAARLPKPGESTFSSRVRAGAAARFSWTLNLRLLGGAMQQALSQAGREAAEAV